MSWPFSILSFPLIVAAHSYPSLHCPGVYGIYVFFCTRMSSRLAPTHTRSFGRSVVHQSFLFLFFFSCLSLLSTCLLQFPTSLLAFFFLFSQLTILFSFYFLCIGTANCLFSVHTTLYKINRIFFKVRSGSVSTLTLFTVILLS